MMREFVIRVIRVVAVLLLVARVTPLRTASAGELLRDAFSNTTLSANWEVPAGNVRMGNGHIVFTGGQRSYVRSVKTDWAAASFRAEITVTVHGDAIGCAFFGLGEGTTGDRYGNPDGAPSIYVLCGPSGFANGPLDLRVTGKNQ